MNCIIRMKRGSISLRFSRFLPFCVASDSQSASVSVDTTSVKVPYWAHAIPPPPPLNASWSPPFDVSLVAVSGIEFGTRECGKQLNMLNLKRHTKEHCNLSCCPNTRHVNLGNTMYYLICHMLNLICVISSHLFLKCKLSFCVLVQCSKGVPWTQYWPSSSVGGEILEPMSDTQFQISEERLLASSCLSVRPSAPRGTTRFPRDGFSWNLVFEYFSKIYSEN